MVGKNWLKKKDVYKYAWLRMPEGRVVDRALMDSICIVTKVSAQAVSTLVWHTHGHLFVPWLLQQVFRFVGRVYTAIRGPQGVLPMRVGSVASQLDLPSLTPLSIAGCGRLQLGIPHWATSTYYCK